MALVSRIGCRRGLAGPVQLRRLVATGAGETTTKSAARKAAYIALGLAGTGAAGILVALESSPLQAVDLVVHPFKYDWPENGFFASFDHASMRRGYEVYKQVCSACHSLKYIAYRHLVGEIFTENEAKREAEEVMYTDGPDETGAMFERPGKLSDYFKSPYPNEEAARAANNGAFPPDLSFITLARHGGADYVFSLLTGYTEPPAGVELREGQHFNPYFLGGAIGMAQSLFDEAIEYSDGTPASASQLAKDVTCFLQWCSQPDHDMRKRLLVEVLLIAPPIFAAIWYLKRLKFSSIKSRKLVFKPKKSDE